MRLVYFVILGVFAKNIDGLNPNRQSRVTTADSVHIDNFPEVEYPSSITDTSKPFYLNVNPFSSDVQSSFKSLTSGGNTKTTPTIILNLKSSGNSKEKTKHKVVMSEKVIPNPEKNITGVSSNSKEKKTSNTPSIINFENDSGSQEMDKEVTSQAEEEESSDYAEMEYILGLIDNVDGFITTIADVETEFIDITNSTVQIFDEHPNEIATITSDVPSVNNFVGELNERSSHTETSLFDELTNNATVATWLVNEGFSDYSDCNDTQADLSIGEITNVTDIL